jgi:hypothetical protein
MAPPKPMLVLKEDNLKHGFLEFSCAMEAVAIMATARMKMVIFFILVDVSNDNTQIRPIIVHRS